MKRGLQHIALILAVTVCIGCATHTMTPAELVGKNLAALEVGSPALELATNGQMERGLRLSVYQLNGHDMCSANYCPTRITLPAGHAELEILCSLQLDELRLPKQIGQYSGDFSAGHRYRLRSVSMADPCRFDVQDVTAQASPTGAAG
ncbi:MAG: hypothetical protein ACRESU_04765 [Gammaproteobacteria bacterium]